MSFERVKDRMRIIASLIKEPNLFVLSVTLLSLQTQPKWAHFKNFTSKGTQELIRILHLIQYILLVYLLIKINIFNIIKSKTIIIIVRRYFYCTTDFREDRGIENINKAIMKVGYPAKIFLDYDWLQTGYYSERIV